MSINIFKGIKILSLEKLEKFIDQECVQISISHQERLPTGFDLSRKLYRAFHIDPTKYRPSSEALWRRLKNKKKFPKINPFVNLTNLLSLKFQICYGLYDLDKIKGKIEVTIGSKNDTYQGIRKDILNLRGKIILKDEQGPFGNPSSDSIRTCTENSTKKILQVLFFFRDDPLLQTITCKTRETFRNFFSMEGFEEKIIHQKD